MRHISESIFSAAMATVSLGRSAGAETLRWGGHFPQGCNMFTKASEWLAEEVNTRTDGELQINIQFGGVLASVTEIPTAIETGLMDMGNIVAPYFPEQMPVNSALQMGQPCECHLIAPAQTASAQLNAAGSKFPKKFMQ